MGEFKKNLVWINKVSSGSRLAEAESDAKLINDATVNIEIAFKKKLESINASIMLFEQALEHIRIKSNEYAMAPLKEREIFRRRLMVSCKTALEKLREIEKSTENL